MAIGVAAAYNEPPVGGTPSLVGHSVDELNLDPLYIDWDNERVGIGTATPAEKLEVSGNITLSGAAATINLLTLQFPLITMTRQTKHM